ncbi:TonB-dependent receptor [Mesonia ostreae]|uniref:TonB-dependent receptor n=1 Tax=Mesonia ostreae TaxID=861110 RepID=A0ABU2KH99_9FLAO|nr:TonB-dependent receptor [Mesonia ostreae]MDT0294081.1 TonB-dependent receptor [Mesonia ostreae]
MKTIWTCAAFLLLSFSFYAQNCSHTLTGKVIDFHTGDPLIYAIIKIANKDIQVYSDFEGNFSIENLCEEKIELKITHPSCQDLIYPVLIEGDTYKKIKLEHHLEQLGEVSITGQAVLEKVKTGQEQKIDIETLERYSSASLGDALKEVSGVSTLSTGNNVVKPMIQGLHSSRVLIMNQGVRMADQEWGAEHAPNIDLNSAGNITVVKGASALQYGGDAIGGAVIVEPERIPVKDTLYGKTILSGATNGRGGAVTTSLTKSFENAFYGKIQGTFKKFGDYKAPDYVLSNTGNEEKDFSIGFGRNTFSSGFDVFYSYYNTEIGILRSSHIGNVNDLIRAINSREPSEVNDFTYQINPPKQEVEHHLARLKYYKRLEGLGKWNIQYDYQLNNRLEYDLRTGEDKGKPSVDLELQTHTLSTNFKFDAQNEYSWNVGLNGSYQMNYPNPLTGVRRLIPDYEQFSAGAFALGEYKLSSDWLVEAGLRYDYTHLDAQKYYLKSRWNERNYNTDFSNIITAEVGNQYLANPVFDFHNLSATVGVRHSFDSFQLSANYALANRAPNPSELFADGLHHSAAVIELGNLRFKAETSQKIGLDFRKDLGDFRFGIAPFCNRIGNFLLIKPTGVETTIRGAFPVWEYEQVDARMFGVDIDWKYQISKQFAYRGSFAYVNGRDIKNEEDLIQMPPVNFSNTIRFQHEKWHQLQLNLTGDYVARQHQYPDHNFKYDVLENGSYVSTLVDVSTPPKDYFLLGFEASATFNPFEKGSMQVGLHFNNLLNTSYRDYLNRLRYYADNLGRNAMLQVKLEY